MPAEVIRCRNEVVDVYFNDGSGASRWWRGWRLGLKHDVFKHVRRQRVFSREGGDDIPRSFRCSTKEWWAFTPSHLEAEGDNDVNVIESSRWGGGRQHIAKVPCGVFVYHQAPEPIFYVNLGKHERVRWRPIVRYSRDQASEGSPKLYHDLWWR